MNVASGSSKGWRDLSKLENELDTNYALCPPSCQPTDQEFGS